MLGSIIQFAYGAEQARKAEEAIKSLPEYQRYDTVAEIKDLLDTVNRLSRNPYSASSNSAFQGGVAQAGANAYNRGISQDANLASSILGGVQTSGMQQFGQREIQGDSLRAQYLSMLQGLAGSVQNISNMNIGEGNQRLLMREQALGQALSQGRQKMYQGAVQFGDWQENTSEDIVSSIFSMGQSQGQPDKVTNTGGGNTYSTQQQGPTGDYESGSDYFGGGFGYYG